MNIALQNSQIFLKRSMSSKTLLTKCSKYLISHSSSAYSLGNCKNNHNLECCKIIKLSQ